MAEEAQNEGIGPQNLQVGLVLISDQLNASTQSLFERHNYDSSFVDLAGPWTKFFAHGPNKIPQFLIPSDWANYFTALLMSPGHFSRAKQFMQSNALLGSIDNGQKIGFTLPASCPVKTFPSCTVKAYVADDEALESASMVIKSLATDMIVDLNEAPPVDEEGRVRNKKNKGTVLVETEVRRSPRIKVYKKGFKDPICKDKSCLGYNAKPPSLSTKAIRSISSTLCDLDASQVTDAALSKKKKSQLAPVGVAYQKKKDASSKKDAATSSKNDDAPK